MVDMISADIFDPAISPFCTSVESQDAQLARLRQLLLERGETLASLDTGLAGKVFRPAAQSASPNGIDEPQEIYHRAIEVIEGEILNLGDISPEKEKELFAYKAWQAGFRLPWLLYDGDPCTRGDVEARLKVYGAVSRISKSDNKDLIAEGLYHYVKELLPVYKKSPEMNVLAAIAARKGDCTEFSMLLYMMMRKAGLEAGVAYISVDSMGDAEEHVAVAVNLDGMMFVVDPVPPYNSFPALHQKWEILPLLSVLFVYHRNQYIEIYDGTRQRADLPICSWLAYDPTCIDFFSHEAARVKKGKP